MMGGHVMLAVGGDSCPLICPAHGHYEPRTTESEPMGVAGLKMTTVDVRCPKCNLAPWEFKL